MHGAAAATINRESFVGAHALLFNLPGASPPIFNQRSYFLFLCARSHQVAPTGVILVRLVRRSLKAPLEIGPNPGLDWVPREGN